MSTVQHVPTSGVSRKLKDIMIVSEHFFVSTVGSRPATYYSKNTGY